MKLDKTRQNARPAQGSPSTSTLWVELFRPYRPSSLSDALQNAAMQAGWIPPWDREEQRSKKSEAGKRSGRSRAGLAQIRDSLINLARAQLTPEQRRSPYSEASIDALEEKYRNLLTKDVSDPDIVISVILSVLSEADRKSLKKASRETLKKDLKAIRKMRGVSRELKT
jgi:hypothetical protein